MISANLLLLVQCTCVLPPCLLFLFTRAKWSDPSVTQDAGVLLFFLLVTRHNNNDWTFASFCIESIVAILVWVILAKLLKPSAAEHASSNAARSDDTRISWTRPVILPCRTTHSRVFPQKHSFSYSYLFVGIHVGWVGCSGNLLSADNSSTRGWWHVDPADYLARGDGHLGLRGKLDVYLRSQGVEPSDFPFAYLTTAPRFCGYSFNPVSFWYLYSAEKRLKAMILEVNNTFDERRMYFLQTGDQNDQAGKEAETESQEANGMTSTVTIFSNEWKKDFHVSPFNSREGSYKLLAHDPNPFENEASPTIANTINLMSSGNHKKLIARVYSTQSAVDPSSINNSQKVRLIAQWGWVGLMTFPRILREAWKLYFKKSLEVFFRPEVAKGSIARHATETEKTLEPFFLAYLKHIVDNTSDSISITYRPAPGTGTHSEVILNSPSAKDNKETHCDFDVLSPVFYSRFVHYAHTSEALDREFLCTDVKNRTIHLSNASILGKLFGSRTTSYHSLTEINRAHVDGYLESRRWRALQWLRCAASEQSYPNSQNLAQDLHTVQEDIRQVPLSELDDFVSKHSERAFVYRRHVEMLFLAQRYTFGLTAVVGLADFVLKLCIAFGMHKLTGAIFGAGAAHAFIGPVTTTGWLYLYSVIKGFETGSMTKSGYSTIPNHRKVNTP